MLVKCCLGFLAICFVFVDANRNTIRRHFATKSRYPSYEKNEDLKTPESCKPLHLNMVFRHGTRYPGTKDIKGMTNLARDINQFFTKDAPAKYGNLKLPWTNRFYYGDKNVAEVGEKELYNISKRLLERFPSLFNPQYSNEKHYFVSTSTPRASQSASAFSFGLFEGKGHLGSSRFQPVSLMTTSLTDPVLRFYDTCPKYKKLVSKNKPVSLVEFHKFKEGPEMGQVKKEIADRLNISALFTLTAAHVQYMFLSCAYEFAIYGSGQWCSVFEDDDIDIIEYLYDIKNYWKRGYGYKINYDMSCLLLQNLTESVRNVVEAQKNSDAYPHAIFHFSHAETVIPLLCIMGLFNDKEALLANNYHRQKERQFQTSNMAPFSGNVAVVLYSCEEMEIENNADRSFYVQVLLNEKAAPLPCCDFNELCSLQKFLACFGDIKEWCNFSEICANNETEYLSSSESHKEL